jgi:hypothetical protein
MSSALTHLQQLGGLRDGVCPAGQAAQRTVEQSTFAASDALSIVPVVPVVPVVPEASPVDSPVVAAVPPPIVPSVPVWPVPVPVQAASASRTANRIIRIHDLFMRAPLLLPRPLILRAS